MSLSTPAPSMTEFVRISGILERSPELRKQNIKHKNTSSNNNCQRCVELRKKNPGFSPVFKNQHSKLKCYVGSEVVLEKLLCECVPSKTLLIILLIIFYKQ